MQLNVKEPIILKTHLKLSRVVDGDGLILIDLFTKQQEEIRFLGIDAPEKRGCRKLIQDERETHIPGQLLIELGIKSFNFLLDLVQPEINITIELEKLDHTDIYGRTLAYVYLHDGRCLNEIMVSEGYAKPFDRYFCRELPNYQIQNMKAKNERKGLYAFVDRF
jgi:micrococcal nuclease